MTAIPAVQRIGHLRGDRPKINLPCNNQKLENPLIMLHFKTYEFF